MSSSPTDTTQEVAASGQVPEASVEAQQSPKSPPSTPPSRNSELAGLKSTPLKAKVSSSLSVEPIKGKGNLGKYRRGLAAEMDGHFVEVSYDVFMNSFVPGPSPTAEDWSHFESFDGSCFDKKEVKMYTEFCRVVQTVLNVSSPQRLSVKDTGDWPDTTDRTDSGRGGKKRPDVVIYPTTEQVTKASDLTKKDLGGSSADSLEDRKPHLARVRWAWICVPVELKTSNEKAPFEFSNNERNPFLRRSLEGQEARGQIAEYAAKILRRQHRQFCFMIVVCQRQARLIRWDRAGAVVSEPFDFVEHREKLFTFIYRLDRMDDAQRGYDPTAVLATEEEREMMKECRDGLTGYRLRFLDEAMEDGWPIYKITVRPQDLVPEEALRPSTDGSHEPETIVETDTQPRCFLVGKRYFASDSLVGRGTMGYVAYDMATGKLVFMKDSWRVDLASATPERDVFIRLWRRGVRNIATPISGGDVHNSDGQEIQRTRTQEFLPGVLARIHYRLIVKEVGRPLEEYTNGHEMAKAVLDALEAHKDAWEKADVLHRDISVGNILVYEDPEDTGSEGAMARGILNDWDLCKYKEAMDNGATQFGRSGTWQFMSALLLRYPGRKRHEVSDDLESFVHVFDWLCLRFHQHQRTNPQYLEQRVRSIYDFRSKDRLGSGLDVGGYFKLDMMTSIQPHVGIVDNPPLKELEVALTGLCHMHFTSIDISAYDPVPADQTHPSSDVSTTARPGPTLASQSWSEKVRELIAQLSPPEPALADHREIISIFQAAVSRDDWFADKGPDKFAQFESLNNTKMVHSSEATRGSKRKTEGSSDSVASPRVKWSRGSTGSRQAHSSQPELAPISEDLEAQA